MRSKVDKHGIPFGHMFFFISWRSNTQIVVHVKVQNRNIELHHTQFKKFYGYIQILKQESLNIA